MRRDDRGASSEPRDSVWSAGACPRFLARGINMQGLWTSAIRKRQQAGALQTLRDPRRLTAYESPREIHGRLWKPNEHTATRARRMHCLTRTARQHLV